MKIYYYCPAANVPRGGIKVIYKHVELLSKKGFEVYVLHSEPNFVCTWFEHESPIAYRSLPRKSIMQRLKQKFWSLSDEAWTLDVLLPNGKHTEINSQDILVIPEVYGPYFEKMGLGIPKVIFNQNVFYTFDSYPMDCESDLGNYVSDSIKAGLVVSDNNQELLQTIFPELQVFKVSPYVNPQVFNYSETKRNVLSYMPRKNPKHARHIINALKFKGLLKNIEVVAIDQMSEEEVAKTLKKSLIFLSLGFPEGFSLPPAEAMACGALTVGYHGQGGLEYFSPEWSYPANIWDTNKIVTDIESIINEWEEQPTKLSEKMKNASAYITEKYSEKNITEQLLSAWSAIIRE